MQQALADIRVVEFTAGMAGPWIGRMMAWAGAEVVRVETHARPGVVRLYIPPREPKRGVQPRLSPWFTDWDAGKLFVALDLRRPEAVELACRLVARCDIVIENQSSGVMEKLGLGYEHLRAHKPDLIFLSSNGYGDDGPYRRYVSWGPNIEAISGLAAISGFPERDCAMTQYAYPDSLSALHGLFAVLCALEYRDRTGEGQRISLSQFEASANVIGPQLMEWMNLAREPHRLGNTSLDAAPHGCYRCRGEDRWCAITILDTAQWRAFCRVLERPEWIEDQRFADREARLAHAVELDRAIESWTRTRSPHEVMQQLQAAGGPAGAVQTTEDQLERDVHLALRGYFERVPHLAHGEVLANGIPLGLTATPGRTERAGAAVGEDNRYVFTELLGLDESEIERLEEIGAIERGASGETGDVSGDRS